MASTNIKLTYFNIEGAAEKVRLALCMNNIQFVDERIQFEDWEKLKPNFPYGQVPVLSVNGRQMAQSGAMLRWIGSVNDSTLYPIRDPEKLYKIEEVLGVWEDEQKAIFPCLYLLMKPTNFGHPEGFEKTAEGMELIKNMRVSFLEKELPRFMGYLHKFLQDSGGTFLCGDKPTIADLTWLPTLRVMQRGIIEHFPADCLSKYTTVKAWMDRMMEVPAIKKWYIETGAKK